ncbi:MAG: OprO/OprP family phosphate-selective porin, partial [Bacteroidales bacterium]|nr:OprO/OprP family phosphate-selective porin [Bacteroidales bacterium]
MFFGTLLTAQDTIAPVVLACNPIINTKPQFRGTLKVRGEHNFYENHNRFNIANARVALLGNVNEWLSYNMQVDLSADGQFRVLDIEARFRQSKDFSFSIGQFHIPFTQTQQITPRMAAFADLPWVVRYMSGPLRDIGVMANYRFEIDDFPVNFTGTLFNGSGNNNPAWTNHLGHSFRLQFGKMNHIRYALKTY